ncbi:MAG: hypothetical protein AB8F95_18200 [Bacteroidia bacterium]
MFRFIILILTSLLLFSCQNDDTPDLALITIEASESLYSAPDQIWRVSISDLGGNIMDTRPLVIGGTTELGAFINKKERPEKVHVHIIRENLIPDRESYFIETFSEVNIGSSIVYNNSGKGTGFRTVKATANLSNVTNPISLQRNHSIVSAGINWVNSFNEDLNNPGQYTGSVLCNTGTPFSVYSAFRKETGPETYFWNFSNGVQENDTLRLTQTDYTEVTNSQEAALATTITAWDFTIEGGADDIFYPIYEADGGAGFDKVAYFTPDGLFNQYHTKSRWRDEAGKTQDISSTSNEPKPFGEEAGFDITIQDVGIQDFHFSTTGSLDYVTSSWSYLERINSASKSISWNVHAPATLSTGSLIMPTIPTDWTTDRTWPASAAFELYTCQATNISWIDDYDKVIQYLSDYSQRLGSNERPALGEKIETVYPVIP